MKGKTYNLVKALSWYTIGSVLIKSVNFFTLRLFTDLLSTTDYGIFGIYQSYLSIFEMLILFGTSHTIKMVKYDEEMDYDKYVSSIIYIPMIGTVLLVSFTRVIFCFTTSFAELSQTIWYAIFISAGAAAICNIIVGKLILEGEYKKYIAYSLSNTVLNIGVSVLLCYTLFQTGNAYWARIIGGLFANIFCCVFLMTSTKTGKPNFTYMKRGIILGLPLLIHAIATQILVQTDKIVISHLSNYGAVGIYSAATSIVVIPTTILNSVENSWSPWYYDSISKKEYVKIKQKNTMLSALFAVGIALFVLVSPEVVRLMTNRDYWDAIYVLIPLSIATYAELIYVIPLNLELYYKKNAGVWVYTVAAVVVNLLCDIAFVKFFGYLASAYVTCASRILLFFLHYKRAKGIDKNEILSIKVIITALFVLLAVNVITVFLVDMRLVRWMIVIAVLAVIMVQFVRYSKNRKAEKT